MQRREVLRLAAGAVGAGSLGRFIAGCTGGDGARSAAAGLERELHVLAHAGAFEPAMLERFGTEMGVRVTLEQYEPRAGAPFPGGDAGFDLLTFPGPAPRSPPGAGRLAPIDPARVPAIERLLPVFRATTTEILAVPFAWEATGIAWRPSALPEQPGAAPDTWCVFFEPALSGRMTLLDSARDVLGAMLLLRGRSLNATEASVLRQARDDALACRPFLDGFRPAGRAPILAEETVVCQARSGEAMRAMRGDAGISFGIPREGGPLFAEHIALAASAAHPRAAHAFVDYILRPEISAGIAAASGRYSPLAAASAPPLPLDRLEPVLDPGDASTLYDGLWMEIQSA
ncbi:MAG TPA: extracellular solute-binding protein [Gemmatimonadales bacterium]